MSKLNGDKARHYRQQYRKAVLRQRRRKLAMRLAVAKPLSKADK